LTRSTRSARPARERSAARRASCAARRCASTRRRFLAGVSSCGVTLIEGHAKDVGLPLRRLDVVIEGVRAAAEPNRFASVAMTFELAGVTQQQAESLVEVYRQR
jgi:hypothetical protein